MSTPRTWLDNLGCFSFVGLVATLMLLLGNGYAQTEIPSWAIYRSDPGLSGRANVEGPTIPDLFWTKTIGIEKIQSPVVAANGTIIFTSRGDRFVYALNPDGSEKWRFSHKLPNGSFETFSHPPSLGSDGTLYIGSHEGGLFAINLEGTLKWRANVNGYVSTAPNFDKNGNIYLATDDTQIYAFNPAGALLGVNSLDGIMPSNTPAILPNAQIYAPAGNSIFVFNTSLKRIARWLLPNLGEVGWAVSDANGSVLYAGSATTSLVIALDAQTGKQIWSYSYEARFGKPSQPALGPDGTIYFAGFDAGLLVALQPDGKEKWTHDQGSSRYKTMPVVDASGDIYIVNEALGFVAFAPNKTQLWNLPNVQCKYAPAFGPDGTIYVPSMQKLYAVRHQPPYPVRLKFVSGDSQTGCIDSVLAKPIVAKVFDQYDKPFERHLVHFRPLGSLQDTSVPTDSLGEAKYFWRLGHLLGEQKLEISSEYNNQPLIGSPDTAIAFAVGPKIDGASEVVFDTTAVKEARDATYVVFNHSGCILTIDSVKIKDDSHPSFFIRSTVPISNILIPPGGSYEIPLQFAPLDSGSHVATLLIYSNDAANSPKQVTLRGEATTRPEIFVDPTSVPFGEILVGKDSTRLITISNVGSAPLIVSALVFSDPAYATNLTTPFSIAVGGSRVVPITFTPTQGRQYPATLKIFSNDPNNGVVEVALSGSGKLAPEIEVSPLVLDFGKVCLDSCLFDTLTISNTGNDTLVIRSLKSADTIFTVEDKELVLLPGESVKVPVAFCPKEVRSYVGKLTIESNDPDKNPVVVELHGEGIGPEIVLEAKPDSLALCKGESATVEFSIINTSNCTVRVDSIRRSIVFKQNALLAAPEWVNVPLAATIFIPPQGKHVELLDIVGLPVDFELRVRVRSNATPDPATLTIPVKVKPSVIAAVETVDFDTVRVGASKTLEAKAWAAQCQIEIISAKITGRDSFAFDLKPALTYPIILNEGQAANIPVTFHPKEKGIHTAILEVFSNSQPNPIKIVLIGNGEFPQPDIDVKPLAVDFGAPCTDSLIAVTVANVGDTTLHVSKLEFTNPAFSTSHSDVFDVAPGASEKVLVRFKPTVAKMDTGSLLIYSNDPDEPIVRVSLKGEGGAPDISSNNVAEFGSVPVQICNGKSNADTLIHFIKNDGTCALEITGLLTSAPFSVISPATPITIAPGASMPVALAFTPQDTGSFTVTLRIASNDPDENPFEVTLRGKGVAEPKIEVAPLAIDFGEVCDDSSMRAVKIYNRGAAALRVTNLVFTNPAFVTTHATNFTIASCDSETVWVRFDATTGKADTGSLVINSNDPNKAAVNVALQGKGGLPNIAGNSAIQFKNVEVQICAGKNNADTTTYVLRNNGTCDLVINALRTRLPFAVISPALPQTVHASGSLIVTLTFTPQTSGSFNDTLFVESNDPDGNPFVVRLSGNGKAQPDIEVEPLVLDFGEVEKDSTKCLPLTVRNVGELELVVAELSISNPVFATETREFALQCKDDSVLTICFTPKADIAYLDTLWIVNNDPDENPTMVILKGNGTPAPPPMIVVSPLKIDFGKLCADSLVDVKVSNLGRSPLFVSNLVFTNSAFSTTHAKSFTVLPGKMDTIKVRFDVTFAKADTGSLLIHSNDLAKPIVRVELKGEGGAPDIAGASRAIFRDVEVQDCSGMDNNGVFQYRLQNTGTCTLTVHSFSVKLPFSVAFPTVPFKIPPQGSVELVLIFDPEREGTFTDTLFVHSDDPDENPFKVVLSGKGVFLPDIDVRPTELVFDTTLVGNTSVRSLRIANFGAKNLVVSNFIFSHPDFSTPITSLNLACAESSFVAVTFKPSRVGNYNETLTIVSNDPNEGSVIVPLIAYADSLFSEISIVPKPLQFPNVCLGSDHTLCLTVKNTGNRELIVRNWYTLPGGGVFKTEVNEFKLGIDQQNNTSVCVTFAPLDTLEYRGFLVIESNAPSSPDTVVLIGRGVSPSVAGKKSLLFSNTGVGRSSVLPYVILGDTLCDLRITALTITGKDSSDFAVVGISIPPDSVIAPHDSLKFSVEFKPKALGQRTARLNIWSNDKRTNPFVVLLEGNGTPGQLTVIPNPLEVKPSCVGVIDTIEGRIVNTGPGNITIYPPLQLASQAADSQNTTFRIIEPVLEKETTLTPGQFLKVVIAFKAEIAGEFSDELLVRLDSANAEPKRFPIKGEAREQGAHIALDRTVVSFGGYLDLATAEEKVKITNAGCERLTIEDLKLVHEKHFKITSDLSGVILDPDSSVFASVIFKGNMFETIFTDTMLVFSNDSDISDRPKAVKLTGAVGNGNDICVSFTPDTVDFGEVPVGNEKNLPVVIKNCTPGTRLRIKLGEVVKDKEVFVVPLLGETELFPGAGETINIVFKPLVPRAYAAVLLVEVWIKDSLATKITEEVVLLGTGTGVDEVVLRPNVVTPNDDGKNDEAVFTLPKDLKDVTLHIFDLRGLRVIVLDDRDNSKTIEWNGRDENKQIVLPGPYLWLIQAQGQKVKSGQIVVIR